ncbi:MAG: cysteine--tRNA ligase [Desulfobacterales bacterium]|nr:cysteine--tRNA ligase [Desulfobacterales bacterium]
MNFRIYNTLSGNKEVFKPIRPGKVKMYVCGPTAYDSCHIGHARSAVVFDVMVRYLRHKELEVLYVRNFTDVDDKIINRANELGMEPSRLAEKYISEFYHDMDALKVLRADHEPRATEHIQQMITVIETLIQKEMAYQINGDVFFSVESFKGYGKLSGRKLEDMEAGARVDVDEKKRNPFDFALWKSSKPGEPSWDSPWGKGRPGWHIECSAMSTEYLGKTFDIHGGGKDLIFPHHENEIAQSEAAFGKPFATYWVHNGFVNIAHEKMSKSLGNFLLIKDVLTSHHPEVVRLFLLSNHYRSPIDYSQNAMDESVIALDKVYALLDRVDDLNGAMDASEETPGSGEYWERFCESMDDDFNTARGIGVLFEAVRSINRTLDENQSALSLSLKNKIIADRNDILQIGRILGILSEPPKSYFSAKKHQALEKKAIDPAVIEKMIQDRIAARKAKDWAKADQIRKHLSGMNVHLEDRPDGTVWKIGD